MIYHGDESIAKTVRDIGKWLVPLVSLGLAEILAGITLRFNVDLLVVYPVLLIITPGLMDLRGDVYGAMGYRLTKALHLGLAQPKYWSRENLVNLATGYVVSIIATSILALIGLVLSLITKLNSPDPLSLLFLASISTLIVFVFLTPLTFSSIIYLYKTGRDPSTFVAAIVTGIGDFTTPLVLLSVAYFHEVFPWYFKLVFLFFTYSMLIPITLFVHRNGGLKDLLENLSSSIIASTGSSIGGFILATRVALIESNPEILGVLPAFNAVIGAAMGYLGSKLNIDLHIGVEEPTSSFRGDAISGFIATYTSIATAGIIVTLISPIALVKTALFVLTITLSVLIVYTLASTTTYILTVFSYREGWDPDNIVFPIMTTFVDLLGPIVVSTLGLVLLV